MADFNHAYIGRLVQKAQKGDSDAFAELYAITYQHTYNYAAHYLRDMNLAQDALQETYILALRNITGIKEPALFVAWLNQICFRVCYDMERKNRQEYGENNPELLELVSDDYIDHNPEDVTETADEASRLKEAIMSLPFRHCLGTWVLEKQRQTIPDISKTKAEHNAWKGGRRCLEETRYTV